VCELISFSPLGYPPPALLKTQAARFRSSWEMPVTTQSSRAWSPVLRSPAETSPVSSICFRTWPANAWRFSRTHSQDFLELPISFNVALRMDQFKLILERLRLPPDRWECGLKLCKCEVLMI